MQSDSTEFSCRLHRSPVQRKSVFKVGRKSLEPFFSVALCKDRNVAQRNQPKPVFCHGAIVEEWLFDVVELVKLVGDIREFQWIVVILILFVLQGFVWESGGYVALLSRTPKAWALRQFLESESASCRISQR
jgi:hypothetical protein